MMKVTVIGAGNGGLTAAYVLAKNGNEVCIYDSPKFPAQVNAVEEKGGITALSEDNGMKICSRESKKLLWLQQTLKKQWDFQTRL